MKFTSVLSVLAVGAVSAHAAAIDSLLSARQSIGSVYYSGANCDGEVVGTFTNEGYSQACVAFSGTAYSGTSSSPGCCGAYINCDGNRFFSVAPGCTQFPDGVTQVSGACC